MSKRLPSIAAAVLMLAAAAPPALASEQQDLVDRARMTVDHLRTDKSFGNAPDLMKSAKAILVVPDLVKGGFFIGGEGGDGVLLVRNSRGSWSYPAFYTLASASFGLQIGIETAELVLFLMNQQAVDAFLSDEVKLGAQAGLAIATLGSTAEAATTTNVGADVVVWSASTGAYAGLTLNGSYARPDEKYNTAYYGRALTPEQIVLHGQGKNDGASQLRRSIESMD